MLCVCMVQRSRWPVLQTEIYPIDNEKAFLLHRNTCTLEIKLDIRDLFHLKEITSQKNKKSKWNVQHIIHCK